MQILRTIPFYRPVVNGPINQAYQISTRLAESGTHSHIYTTDHRASGAAAHEQLRNVTIHRLKEKGGFLAYRHLENLDAMSQETPDLIHAHLYRNKLTHQAALLARKRNVPYVIQPHGTLFMYKYVVSGLMKLPYMGYDLARKRLEVLSAQAVIVATDQEKREAIQFGVSEERIHVIPVGCDPIAPGKRLLPGDHDQKLKLLFVGRIAPDRNVEQIIQAVESLPENEKETIHLDIVGPVGLRSLFHDGERYLQSLKQIVKAKHLENCITFQGPKYGDELREAYLSADLFLYTSLYENFGQSVLEAAACGCPIVATDTGVASDIVTHSGAGKLVETGNATLLQAAISERIQNRDTLKEESEKILAYVSANFKWQKIIKRYQQAYQQSMDTHSS